MNVGVKRLHIETYANLSDERGSALHSSPPALTAAGALMSAGLDPGRLVIEITEAVLIGDDDAALPIMHELRGMGIKIALERPWFCRGVGSC
jgi:EAL domain-containing protein (putative c-di-GMP-specific phosphodiesterase class I)